MTDTKLIKRFDIVHAFVFILAISAGGCGITDRDPFFSGVVDVKPARVNSPYKAVLQDCAYSNTRELSCSMDRLPLIGQEKEEPTVDDIMERVVVSHAWMGERFETLLQALPPDILTLTKPLTAVVIASDVRPSRYYTGTGAIYIDPSVLWFTQEEKAAVDTAPDYRAGCGDELNYASPWRYVKGNDYAYLSSNGATSRTMDDILYGAASLLYHELAHANDFIPPAKIKSLIQKQNILAGVNMLKGKKVADLTKERYPLSSRILSELAKVNFTCAKATQEQIAYTPIEVATEFIPQLTNDEYGFITKFEDVAMLFEEMMMDYHYGIKRDIAFTSRPTIGNPTANDYIVAWGERGRIGSPHLLEKIKFISSQILPDYDFTSYFTTIEPPIEMTAGLGWIDNLSINPTAPKPDLLERYKTSPPAEGLMQTTRDYD